jgi:hypothetical protein
MRIIPFLAALLLAPTLPAAASEPLTATPAAHEETARAVDDLAAQLHGIGTRWREHFMETDPLGGRPLITLMLRNRSELGLSPAQIETLERLRADFQREATKREGDLRAAEKELAALIDAEQVDLGQIEVKVREIERQRTDLLLARIRTIEQGKQQLTPDQRSKLRILLSAPRPLRPRAGMPDRPMGQHL